MPTKSPQWDPNANHGRYSKDCYTGCEQEFFPLTTVKEGDLCPSCKQAGDHGRLCKEQPLVILNLIGQPLITGTRYAFERVRCSFCGDSYTTDVPAAISNSPKYAPSCASVLAVGRYWLGLPFKRIESHQAIHHIPLADATQHDITKKLELDVRPVFTELEYFSANTELTCYDDMPNRILEQKKLVEKSGRKGVYTTAVVSKYGDNFIYLYYTSNKYAGENIDTLLEKRNANAGKLATMTDASPMNRPKKMDDKLLERWIICFCLVHGRRKFFELVKFYDQECSLVLNVIGKIYQHETACKEQKLDSEQRLSYHQQHSLPLMESLRVWLSNKLLFHEIEPNSDLGKSIRYMLKHWDNLTKFLHHPGAMIDNSISERAVKVAIRHRRNSLFFKTHAGAQKGDRLMSIICTAVRCGTNPVEYLNALQVYKQEMTANPEEWLPWNYQETIKQMQQQALLEPAA